MKSNFKRLVALILSVIMVVSLLPVAATADTTVKTDISRVNFGTPSSGNTYYYTGEPIEPFFYMFKVEPAVPYSADYNTCIKEAKERVGNAPVKEKPSDISAYDTVFIMSPIYWGTYAPEVETALEGLDFTGKTVRVISTHEGSGLGSMVSDVKKMCKDANVDGKGLAVRGSSAKSSKAIVKKWLGM